MSTKPKRARAPDYSEAEISVIRSNFSKYHKVLSAKHSNEITQKAKDKIYQEIATEVNAIGVAERSIQSIKDKWQTLKKNVKDKVASAMREKRKQRERTGGGENPALDDPDVLDNNGRREGNIRAYTPGANYR